MRKTCFLLVLMSLLFISGCKEDAPVESNPETGRTVDPLRCQNGGEGCDMNWIITKSRNKFPAYIQLLVNDKIIADECQRTGNVAIMRDRDDAVYIKIWNYIRLDGTQDFKLQINDLKDCYEPVGMFYTDVVRDYKVNNVNGVKHVQINL